MTSSYAFNNTTEMSNVTIKPVGIKPVTNYAKTVDEPTVAVLSNKTCPLDQGELLTYRANEMDHISTSLTIQNPTKVRNGVQYVVKLEEILRTKDTEGNIVSDEPVVAYLTVRHQKTGNISEALVNQVINRLMGAVYKSDGTTRIADLMRSALVPVED